MSSTEDYEYIEAKGQTIRINSGETWENKLIDLGDGRDITIAASDTNWTIRNIGVIGTWHHTTHEYIFSLADSGGNTSVFENVYIDDGDPDAGPGERGGAVWVHHTHSGRIEFNQCNFNVDGALGVYGSAPGYNGDGGTIHFDHCYAYDNHHSGYRIADNGSTIENSVVYKTGERSASRAVWIWEGYGGGSTLENVDLITNGVGGGVVTNGDPEFSMTDVCTDDGTGTGCTPNHYVPEGCPTDAEAAARGESGGGGGGGGGGSDPPDEPAEHEWADGLGSIADSYLAPTGGNETGSLAVYEGAKLAAGHTYEIDFEIGPNEDHLLGFAFGLQSMDFSTFDSIHNAGFSSYLVWSNGDQSHLERYDEGSAARNTTGAAWPVGEPLRATIDYRDSSSDVVVTITDSDGSEVTTLTLTNESVYDGGKLGFYQWYDAPFRIYRARDPNVDTGDPPEDPGGITEYRLYFDGVHHESVDPSQTEATIGGLSPGEEVEVGVTAVRDGEESDPVTRKAETVPEETVDVIVNSPSQIDYNDSATFEIQATNTTSEDREVDVDLYFGTIRIPAPSSVAVDDVTDTTISVSWEFSESDESEVDEFIAAVNNAEDDRFPPSRRSAKITGLEPATEYEIALRSSVDGQTSGEVTTVVETEPQTTDGGGGGEGPDPTIVHDYDSIYDPSLDHGGLESTYDHVADDREGGHAGMEPDGPSGTVSDVLEAHTVFSGQTPTTAKSANVLVDFADRGFDLPQEVYGQIDVYVPAGFDMAQYDTWRFYWNMNRYSGNEYDSNTGNGFSTALGFSDRENPDGDYHFFSYRYDSTQSGSAGNFTVADGHVVNEGEWWTLGMYVKCNDPGESNAVQKYWVDGDLALRHDGHRTSADRNGWNHEWGTTSYYINHDRSTSPSKDRTIYFDNHRLWADDDIPSEIRE